jgi:UPF0176 protein
MFTIVALYHFTRFENHFDLRELLQKKCEQLGICGSLLLATEGINGTIAGTNDSIEKILSYIKDIPDCANLEYKKSVSKLPPFPRMKVKLKNEIVTMGQPNIDPKARVGHYVDPSDWNKMLNDPDVVVIDTRNEYEVDIGTFKGAINPHTSSFREFPAWWEKNKKKFQNKRIAMFCTGGIRCEKSTNYLIGQGVENVSHLKGGILKYLEETPEKKSEWVGDCFVFDARVSVGHELKEGPHELCYACRQPILPKDKERAEYEHGVSCHKCKSRTTESDKSRFRERQKQIQLSRKRGQKHMVGYDRN